MTKARTQETRATKPDEGVEYKVQPKVKAEPVDSVTGVGAEIRPQKNTD